MDMDAAQLAMGREVDPTDAQSVGDVKTVAGFDISWINEMTGIAGMAIMSFPDLRLLHFASAHVKTTVHYRSGYLGFREVPAFVALFNTVKNMALEPDVAMVDGHGILHSRRCGWVSPYKNRPSASASE